jgi:8-oxo-dGTP pyrophosphatase MutT (NUDIX family)
MTGPLALARAHVADAGGTDAVRARILAFIDDHPDALLRTCVAGHLTGSAAVVDPARDRALLVLHRKLGRWLQPGGHADGDGDLAAVALREAEEETGIEGLAVIAPAIDVDVHAIPAIGADPEHLHLDVRFVVVAPEGAQPVANHESLALRWVGVAELDDPALALDASTKRLLRAALRPPERQ